VSDPFEEGFFNVDGGREPITSGFPFHPAINVDSFCKTWEINCGTVAPNIKIVFIDSEGRGAIGTKDRHILERILALAPIISIRIHLVPAQRPEVQHVIEALQGMEISVLTTGNFTFYELILVVPRIGLARMTKQTPASEYSKARRAGDINLTASLREEYLSGNPTSANKTIVFVQPDPARFETFYWDALRDIAEHIVRVANETSPLPAEDAFELFNQSAKWVKEHRENIQDDIPIHDFFRDRVHERLRQIRKGLVSNYTDLANVTFSDGYRVFEGDAEIETDELIKKAMDEFHCKVRTLPRQLLQAIIDSMFNMENEELETTLRKDIPVLVARRQEKLKAEFTWNSSREMNAIVMDVNERILDSESWNSTILATCLDRFAHAVHYDDLPLLMQRSTTGDYKDYRDRLAARIQSEMNMMDSVHSASRTDRLRQIRRRLIAKYTALANVTFSQGYGVFERDPEVDTDELVKKANDEFRLEFRSLPSYLLHAPGQSTFDLEREELETGLRRDILTLRATRQEQLKVEFKGNCSRESDALVTRANETLTVWNYWYSNISAMSLDHFCQAVHCDELPIQMQQRVGEDFGQSCDNLRSGVGRKMDDLAGRALSYRKTGAVLAGAVTALIGGVGFLPVVATAAVARLALALV
jgi:hypothetical protein